MGLVTQLIILIVLVALMVGGTVGIVLTNTSTNHIKQEVLQYNLAQADMAAQYTSNYVKNVEVGIRSFAGRPTVVQAILSDTPEKLQVELSEFVESQVAIEGIGICDAQGIQRVSSMIDATTIGQSFADRDWFQQAVATRQPYLSIPTKSRVNDMPIAPYGIPIMDDQGQLRGTVSGGISLSTLCDAIVNIAYSADTHASIIDTRNGGIILAHSDLQRVLTPVSGENEAVTRLIAGDRGTIETRSSSGEMRLIGFTMVPDLPWGIMVSISSSTALASVDSLRLQSTLIILISVLLLGFLGGWWMVLVTRPLIQLRDASRKLAAGELTHRMHFTQRSEIGELGQAFDQMAASLMQDITDRKQALEVLRASYEFSTSLLENAPNPIHVVNPDLSIRYINQAMEKLTGFSPTESIGIKAPFPWWPEEKQEEYLDGFRETAEKGNITRERLFQKKNGEPLWVKISVIAVRKSGELEYYLSNWVGITELKQVEEKLRESESKLQALFDILPVGVSILDAERNIVYSNPALEGILDISKESLLKGDYRSRAYLKPDGTLMPAEEYASTRAIKERRMVNNVETGVVKENGSVIWTNVSAVPVVFPDWKVVIVTSDITERKQVEEALRRSEENFRRSLDDSPMGIRIVNADGETVYANRALLDIYGYDSLEEFINTPSKKRYTPESYAEHRERVEKRQRGEYVPSNYEISIVRKDGQTHHLEVFRKEVLWNGNAQFQVVYRDITERMRAEELFRNLAENSPVGVYIVQKGKLVYVNPRFQQLTGYSEDELLNIAPYDLVYPEDREIARTGATDMFKGRRTSPYEFRVTNRKGEVRWAMETVASINYGGRRATLGNFVDITERKQAEEREKQLLLELNIASRMATVGEMAAGIAHEINNPLTGVVGFSGLLLKKDLSEDIRKDVDIIREGAQRIASVTDRMLRFARQSKPRRTKLNINDIIETTVAMRAYEMKTSSIEVTTELAPDLPVTTADAGLIQQVFLNIILNAEQAMGLAHHKGSLTIKTERINNTIRVSFKDDGPGIAKKNMEKIFNPFFTTREVGQGTGLGLSVCHGIVTQHGGRIRAESELGKGATFIVELPIKQAAIN